MYERMSICTSLLHVPNPLDMGDQACCTCIRPEGLAQPQVANNQTPQVIPRSHSNIFSDLLKMHFLTYLMSGMYWAAALWQLVWSLCGDSQTCQPPAGLFGSLGLCLNEKRQEGNEMQEHALTCREQPPARSNHPASEEKKTPSLRVEDILGLCLRKTS